MGRKSLRLEGQTFGAVTVIERDFSVKSRKQSYWKYSCGNCGSVHTTHAQALRDNPKSCPTCKMKYRVFPDITLPCTGCGKDVVTKANRYSAYCSYECKHKHVNTKHMSTRRSSVEGTLRQLIVQVRSRAKKKKLPFDLTVEWALCRLEKQQGRCPTTGRLLSASIQDGTGLRTTYSDVVSIDRIDSALGYTQDNCQLVCYHYNVAKNKYSTEEVIQLCKDILATLEASSSKEGIGQ